MYNDPQNLPIMWYIRSEEMVIGSTLRSKLLQILLVLLILAGRTLLFAGGEAEKDPLAEARAAYEARNYNEAILLTAEVMKSHPERFDEAQSLINAIRAAKEKYNATFADLIDLYQDALENQDEEGLSESYTIIKELEELDPFPNEGTEQGLARAREATGNVFNRIRHTNLMDQGLALIQNGEYMEAEELYLSGFELALDIFLDKGYGREPEAEAERLRNLSFQQTETLIAAEEELSSADAPFSVVGEETPPAEISPLVDTFLAEYARFANQRRSIAETLQGIEVLRLLVLNELAAEGTDEIFHLAYLILLHRGRTGVEEELGIQEGILGAADGRWDSGASAVTERLNAAMEARYAEASRLFAEEEFSAASEAFSLLAEVASELERASSLWRNFLAPDPAAGDEAPDYEALAEADGIPEFITYYREINRFAALVAQNSTDSAALARLGAEMAGERGSLAELQNLPLEEIEASRAALGEIVARADLVDQQIPVRRAAIISEDTFAAKSNERLNELEGRAELVQGFFRSSIETFLLLSIRLTAAPLEDEYQDLLILEEQGNAALAGETITFQGASFDARYPSRAAAIYAEVDRRARIILEANEALLEEINQENEWLREREAVAEALAAAEERSQAVRGLIARAALNRGAADDLIRAAEQNRIDGERRYREARAQVDTLSFNINNPNQVENTVTEARDYFLESLQNEYVEILDRRTDSIADNSDQFDIQTLLADLALAKRDYFLPQREEALAEARALIRQQEFEDASRTLNRAEDFHDQIDKQENPEILRLQEFVDRAINTSSAWYISKTDPLYAEMSQLLNLAREDYQTAEQRVDEGRTVGVNGLLANAESKLAAVQNTFPQNLEVGVLLLQIELLRNRLIGGSAAARTEILGEKLDQAETAFNNGEYQKALSLAKSLETIDPGYPGLAELIFEAEIATGQRVREPDPADVRAAENLYADANAIWQNRIQDQYAAALDRIKEAIARYTPFNPPARYISLKNNLEIRVDISAATILSAADQLQYQSALESYQQGNFVQAKLIVDQLIQKGDNIRNPQLLDLQRRIESRL